MCWIGKKVNLKKSDKPITVYKIMSKKGGVLRGPYYNMHDYTIGTTYEIKIKAHLLFEDKLMINAGYHSYSANCRIRRKIYKTKNYEVLLIDSPTKMDINYFINIKKDNLPYVVVKCTIPANTTYYENENGEIVSEKLMVNEEIKKLPANRLIKFEKL